MSAKPGALARIPDETIRNWPRANIEPGTLVGMHISQCSSNGGSVSASKCPRCNRSIAWRYRCALAKLDALARGR